MSTFTQRHPLVRWVVNCAMYATFFAILWTTWKLRFKHQMTVNKSNVWSSPSNLWPRGIFWVSVWHYTKFKRKKKNTHWNTPSHVLAVQSSTSSSKHKTSKLRVSDGGGGTSVFWVAVIRLDLVSGSTLSHWRGTTWLLWWIAAVISPTRVQECLGEMCEKVRLRSEREMTNGDESTYKS